MSYSEMSFAQKSEVKKKILVEIEDLKIKTSTAPRRFIVDNEELSDDVDHANAQADHVQVARIRYRDEQYLKKLIEALGRIDSEEFGLCEECGVPIGPKRLMARPTARECINCREELERDGQLREFTSGLGGGQKMA